MPRGARLAPAPRLPVHFELPDRTRAEGRVGAARVLAVLGRGGGEQGEPEGRAERERQPGGHMNHRIERYSSL